MARVTAADPAVAPRQSSALAIPRPQELPAFFESDMEIEITSAVFPNAYKSELI